MEKIGNIAEISPGYPFRGSLGEVDNGNVHVLQLKDTFESIFIDCNAAAKVAVDDLKPQYLLKSGDLVFRSRGNTNTAAVVSLVDGDAVCAAPLFQIRIKSSGVMPEYLCWFINQPSSQSYLNSHAQGTSVRMIGRDALGDLPISIPPLDMQRKIAVLAELADREERLVKRLADRRKAWISGLLARVASETGNGAETECLPEVGSAPQEDKDNHPEP